MFSYVAFQPESIWTKTALNRGAQKSSIESVAVQVDPPVTPVKVTVTEVVPGGTAPTLTFVLVLLPERLTVLYVVVEPLV